MLCCRNRCDKQRLVGRPLRVKSDPLPSCMEKSPKIAAIVNSALKPTDKLASRLLGSPPLAIASAHFTILPQEIPDNGYLLRS